MQTETTRTERSGRRRAGETHGPRTVAPIGYQRVGRGLGATASWSPRDPDSSTALADCLTEAMAIGANLARDHWPVGHDEQLDRLLTGEAERRDSTRAALLAWDRNSPKHARTRADLASRIAHAADAIADACAHAGTDHGMLELCRTLMAAQRWLDSDVLARIHPGLTGWTDPDGDPLRRLRSSQGPAYRAGGRAEARHSDWASRVRSHCRTLAVARANDGDDQDNAPEWTDEELEDANLASTVPEPKERYDGASTGTLGPGAEPLATGLRRLCELLRAWTARGEPASEGGRVLESGLAGLAPAWTDD